MFDTLYTISINAERNLKYYFIKATQKLHTEYNFGHYSGYIQDELGNILDAFKTSGGVKDKITNEDLVKHLDRYLEE